jgi:hypothetical protein
MHGWKERRAYVAVIVVIGILCGSMFLIGLRNTAENKTKICAVIAIIISTPAVQPTDPPEQPSLVRSYNNYRKFQALNKTFGC